jgi:hypothetical protein
MQILKCLDLEARLLKLFTCNEDEANVHIVPLWSLNVQSKSLATLCTSLIDTCQTQSSKHYCSNTAVIAASWPLDPLAGLTRAVRR